MKRRIITLLTAAITTSLPMTCPAFTPILPHSTDKCHATCLLDATGHTAQLAAVCESIASADDQKKLYEDMKVRAINAVGKWSHLEDDSKEYLSLASHGDACRLLDDVFAGYLEECIESCQDSQLKGTGSR